MALGTSATLLFPTKDIDSAAYIPSFKLKYGVSSVTEDALVTTPRALTITDGLSGVNFHTGFLANFVAKMATGFSLKLLSKYPPAKLTKAGIQKKMHYVLNKIIEEYNAIVDSGILNWTKKTGKKTDKSSEDIPAATTYLSVVLSEENKRTMYNFVQTGDSLAIVFRLAKTEGTTDRFWYKPVYVLQEQQIVFNGPFHLSSTTENKRSFVFVDKFEAKEGDLVLMGSDGLFDNVPFSMLTYIVNYLVAAAQTELKVGDVVSRLLDAKSLYIKDPKLIDQKLFNNYKVEDLKFVPEEFEDRRLLSRKPEAEDTKSEFIRRAKMGRFGCIFHQGVRLWNKRC